MSVDAKIIAEQMCQAWGKNYEGLLAAYREYFTANCEYLVQQNTPILTGPDQAVAAIEGFHAGFGVETIEVDLLKIDQVGNVVWNERIDYMVNASGERFLAIPIAGWMEFNDEGKLIRWHDYWDMRELLALAPTG